MAVVESEAAPAAAPERAAARAARRRGAPRLAPRPAPRLGRSRALLLVVGAGAALLGRKALQDGTETSSRRSAGGGRASLEVDGDRARLVASKLPAPPSGRVYQVWLDRGGKAPEPTNALFSTRRDGSASVDVPGSLDGVRARDGHRRAERRLARADRKPPADGKHLAP